MKFLMTSKISLVVFLCLVGVAPALAVNGKIIDQQIDANGRGYTVIRLWGSHYQMGYAHASLLGDHIVKAVGEFKTYLGFLYNTTRTRISNSVWMPPDIEEELDGMVDCLAVTHPSANISKLDLKVCNTTGDWGYACRSHTCWGRYVQAPIKTLSTRRLDFPMIISSMKHHVLFVCIPDDGSTKWVNFAWPGIVTAAQGVNEFGTLVSLHDYNSYGADISAGRMSRMVACRYALTYANSADISTHLTDTFAELQKYEIMTGTFLNYYAPQGYGGVMACNPHNTGGPDFYHVRTPKVVWHHGEAMVTTNLWTDGTYTPSDEEFGADTYYNDESPKTHESHWNLLSPSLLVGSQRLSVAYRNREDMTIWADGRLDTGRTPRLEYEWVRLFDLYDGSYDLNSDGTIQFKDFNILAQHWLQNEPSVDIAPAPAGDGSIDFKDLAVLAEHWLEQIAGIP